MTDPTDFFAPVLIGAGVAAAISLGTLPLILACTLRLKHAAAGIPLAGSAVIACAAAFLAVVSLIEGRPPPSIAYRVTGAMALGYGATVIATLVALKQIGFRLHWGSEPDQDPDPASPSNAELRARASWPGSGWRDHDWSSPD